MEFGSAIILAGGKSRRMGFDKQQLQVNNRYLTRFHEECLGGLFHQLIVVTNNPELYHDTGFVVVSDEIPEGGPLSGIHVGLKYAMSRYAYVIACDMPHINIDYVQYMKRRLLGRSCSGCVTRLQNSLEPFNAFYGREIVPDIENFLGEGKKSVVEFIQQLNLLYLTEGEIRFYNPEFMFVNLNTREDFERWSRKNRECFSAAQCRK
ncbi:MAG: molybdenum cofactor guanylyltransferase [Syntrophotaleaceae bacterium]